MLALTSTDGGAVEGTMPNQHTPAKRRTPAAKKRTVVKTVRWTPNEWAEIEAAADDAGLSPGEYVRDRALQPSTTPIR